MIEPMSTLHLPTSPELDGVAAALDRAGFAEQPLAVRRALDAVVRRARAANVSPVLIAVLADDDEPEVARLRAFGRVSALLGAAAQRPSVAPAA
jgi:hypothetical protein